MSRHAVKPKNKGSHGGTHAKSRTRQPGVAPKVLNALTGDVLGGWVEWVGYFQTPGSFMAG